MPKIIPPIYFYNAIIVAPKRIRFKSIPQSCSPKLLPKAAVFQSKATVRSMLLQSRKVVPHNYSPKLLSKIATESRVPKQLPKTARKHSVCGRRRMQLVGSLAEVRFRKSTETIAGGRDGPRGNRAPTVRDRPCCICRDTLTGEQRNVILMGTTK